MDLWKPVIFYDNSDVEINNNDTPIAAKDDGESFNLDFFFSDDAKIEGDGREKEAELEKKVKKAPRKATGPLPAPTGTPISPNSSQMATTTDVPYIDSYVETNNLTKGIIIEINRLSAGINTDLEKIRASSSMKSKYTYITNLSSAAASLVSAKLGAIKELNNNITQAHNLELKRAKDLKTFELDKQNDDARMMDLYSAFINAPMGMYDNKLNMPTVPDMMLGTNDPNSAMQGVSLSGSGVPTQGVSPEQLRMRMEGNNNIEEVVMFDPATGGKWFDVIDKSTGLSVPNYPRSDNFLLDDISIESRAGIAKNRNLDRVWPLRIVGNATLNEY